MDKKYVPEPKIGPVGQKVLLLLFGGLALGLTRNPKYFFKILKTMKKDWNRINRYALYRSIRNLYKSQLLDAKDNEDGTTSIVLTRRQEESPGLSHRYN